MLHRLSKLGTNLFIVSIIAVLAPNLALSFTEYEPNLDYEILLPRVEVFGHSSSASLEGSRIAEEAMTASLGGQWRVYDWNPQTDTPRWVYGSGQPLAASVADAGQLETLARGFIADHPSVFGAEVDNLVLSATPHSLEKWAAHFQQTYHGLDVWQAGVKLVISEAGKLVTAGSTYFGDIDLDPNPGIDESQAVEIARLDLPFNEANDTVEPERVLLVLPIATSATETAFHLVWRVRVSTEDPLGIWVTHVDAHTGEIVWRYNDIHFAYGGDSHSDVQPITYCEDTETQPIAHLSVNVSGIGTTTTDVDGNWSIDGSGGNRDVTAGLKGPYIWVWSVYGAPLAAYSEEASEGIPLSVSFDDLNARKDERDVFDAINDIHEFFQLFDPSFYYANQQIRATVNINDCCNAYWNGTINFFTECGGCANTGEIQGVVEHEFGHGVQSALLGGWQGNEGLGEGNSDVMANLMTREAIIGRGFNLNCSSGIRNSNNGLIYPDDMSGQIHHDGQIIAGFHWDSGEILRQFYGEDDGYIRMATTWHFGRELLSPVNQPDQVFATFIADDDDDNLANGTPDYVAYAIGARNHGFTPPEISEGVLVSHLPLDDTMNTGSANVVVAGINSTEAPLNQGSIALFWRLVGDLSWNEESLSPSGIGNNYMGEIPAQEHGEIEYYIWAEDTDGRIGSTPLGAPNLSHEFEVAWSSEHMETDGGWISGAPGDNATAGLWVRVDPVGSGYQPEDDHTNYGTHCWVTGQHGSGQPDNSSDVDGGLTSLVSPVYDLNGASEARLQYRRWFKSSAIDIWRAYISNDGGDTWSVLETTSFSLSGWDEQVYDLVDLLGAPDQLRLKFVVQDTGPDTIVEGGLDDLLIAAVFDITGVDDDLAVQFVTNLDQNIPNPFNPSTEIRFSLADASDVNLSVYDVAGRLVRQLASGPYDKGEHRVTWDGNSDTGQAASSGMYFYRLETAEGRTASKRMLLIK